MGTEWVGTYTPMLSGVVGLLASWVLGNRGAAMGWFRKLGGWGKLGVVFGLCVVYGMVTHYGFGQDVIESVYQVVWMFLGTQVGYVAKPGGSDG